MPTSLGPDASVAVFGYGVEGRASAAWLLRRGNAAITVIAKERPAELPTDAPFRTDTALDALDGIDAIVKSPGIKPSHPLLHEAERRGIPVTTATRLFVEQAGAAGVPIVGVTGSKGKSTTSTLIHLALAEARIPSLFVGNIGTAALDALDEVTAKKPVVVFEMSSYQTHDLVHGPSIAVITRLFPEHLDWHGGKDAYFASKTNIARSQRATDSTIWNATDPELVARAPFGPARHLPYGEGDGAKFERGTFVLDGKALFSDEGMLLRGAHNRLNACAALTALSVLEAPLEPLRRVLNRFAGLPHRLEDLGVHGGVRWVNDSISTAPEAAVAALEALGSDVATYVGGGTDRGFDFTPLARALCERRIETVILVAPGGPKMLEAFAAFDARLAARSTVVDLLSDAVQLAARKTPPGKTALFSPASPSYGVFRNFEDRGEALRRFVAAL